MLSEDVSSQREGLLQSKHPYGPMEFTRDLENRRPCAQQLLCAADVLPGRPL